MSFKYTLKWSGRPNTEVVQLAFAYCKAQIPICKDVCEFIDHQRYLELIAAGEIAGPTPYWGIDQFQVGMIAYSSYVSSYAQSWEHLDMCYKDFLAGYEACEKKYKFLRDWDEAIAHEARRNQYLKKCRRSVVFNVENWNSDCHPIYDPQASKVCTFTRRNGSWKFTIVDNCTGPEFESLVYSICNDCKIPMPEMEPDPRREEARQYKPAAMPMKKTAKVVKR